MNTISEILYRITQELAPLYSSKENALSSAWWILELITGLSSVQLLAKGSLILRAEQERQLNFILEQHIQHHMPLQYIAGSVPFLDLSITVRPPVLIPRPETEYWCSLILECLKKLKNQPLSILDLCTGTGCIALSLAHALPTAHVYAVDISSQACTLAQENKEKNGIENVTIIQSDLYTSLPPELSFDLIVSNPPYISEEEWDTLEPLVKEWEDPQALLAEHHGLAILEALIKEAPQWLKKNTEVSAQKVPQLVVEIGHTQGPAVKQLFEKAGFKNIIVRKDLQEKDRFVTAVLKENR